MPFPKTMDDLKPAGFKFLDNAVCKFCGDEIEWWEDPSGRKIPLAPMDRGSSPVLNHIFDCSGR